MGGNEISWHPRNLTITQRLIALTALAMLPAVAVVIFYIASLHQQKEREVHTLALQQAQMVSLEMERIISGAEGLLLSLKLSSTIQEFESQDCERYLAAVQAELARFLGFAVADSEGTVRCASTTVMEPLQIRDRPYFQEAVETGGFVVGEFSRSKFGELSSLPLALAMKDGAGNVIGVIMTEINPDWLRGRLEERNLTEGSSITVTDRSGVIIAREPFPERFVGTSVPEHFLKLVGAFRPGSLLLDDQDGTRSVLGYYPPAFAGTGLFISVALSTESAFREINASTYKSIAIAVIGAAAVFVIAWMVGEQLFRRPIRKLLDTISAWRRGNDTARTGIVDDGSEIASLAAAIDEYMDKLSADRVARRRAEEHRNLLVRELDHRVKNILATVQAIATQSFRNERSQAFEVFTGRLAAMASTHDMLMKDNWATAEICKIIETAIKPFNEEGRPRFSLSGPPMMIRARAALALSLAVHELCTNAVKYGALRTDAGHVAVKWMVEPGKDGFIFTWTERGGLPVSPPERPGFGTRMIERALAAELSASTDLSFPAEGFTCRVKCALSSIVGDDSSTEKAA
ncbi:sensor histidine kinase [Chelativorans sp. Marseille-P2723]|uniref:sensor histidine kinase n=1 Tax=Chelativorans sp. Marseille-P2723 TaxID=2709133 RepID=UPI00156DECB4|nr:sensor histidine kinase [Chelativorans sp. Marseille-P2723]